MSKKVRVRIAPSPTGVSVHLGNVRTALFNYLFAKKHGGDFIFRIEDTDQARYVAEAPGNILKDLSWLGIRPSEGWGIGGDFGPYSQMERLDIYKKYADRLIAEGKAYRCYCTKDELDMQRKTLQAKDPKAQFKYPGTCRDRKDQPLDKEYVVRFKAPTDGFIEYDDLVFGKIKTPNKENQDFVLMRQNGIPLYNFGCVVDDIEMRITHIIRGRDHMINMIPQILLYQALDVPLPQFAHLPMMLGKDGSKLSKRHGSVSVIEYRDKGYTPGAILNYIARFGWSCGNKEIITLQEMVDSFDLTKCTKSDGRFDFDKFAAVQYEHMKNTSLTPDVSYLSLLQPFLDAHHLQIDNKLELLDGVREKSKTFADVINFIKPIKQFDISDDLKSKFYTDEFKAKMSSLSMALKDISWSEQNIKQAVQNWMTQNTLTLKDIAQPVRVFLTGQTVGLELYKTLLLVGQSECLKRLNANV